VNGPDLALPDGYPGAYSGWALRQSPRLLGQAEWHGPTLPCTLRARNTIMRPSSVVVSWWSVGAWPWIAGDDLCGEEWLDERDVGGDIAGIGTVPSG
jgi:hypothetical protein